MRRLQTIFRRRRPTDLPSGTLTFVLTDIESSTRLWEERGAGMEIAVPRHLQLIARAVERAGGTLVRERGEGDSTFSVFTDATSAVTFALDAQRALHAEIWPDGVELRVRFALHTGEARQADGEYTAPAINRCARIRGLASGGQTLLSERTKDLVAGALPDGASLEDLGTHRLRDLGRPERIAQLCHPDLPGTFPALRSLDVVPHNLPVQLTSFIGRDVELNRIGKLLQSTRMLTLTGTGGLGKTRLALQVGADAVERFSDGVWFVDLAPITSDEMVASAAASALSLREDAGATLEQTLLGFLADKHALLILDNCEHVLAGATGVANAILRGCPEVSILATSRSTLNVAGATNLPVPPMELPSGDGPAEDLASYEAVRLFCERAALRDPGFALSHDNARDVLEVCRRLEGIPLAVELAAAHANVLSPSEIARRLEDRFRLLTGGPDDDPRHATLGATLDWSYGLLAAAERLLLGRLATFAGGFALDAAEEVCSGDGLARDEVFGVLRELVDASFVLSVEAPDEVRFAMLETIRDYALEQRASSHDEHPTVERHFGWYLALAEGTAEVEGPDEAIVLNRLEREHDNLRAALEHGSDPARLAVALARFWTIRGHWTEGRQRLEGAMAASAGTMQARVRSVIGTLASRQGDLASAKEHLEASIGPLRAEPAVLAGSLLSLAGVLARMGEGVEAASKREEAQRIAETSGDERTLRRSLNELAVAAARAGEYHQAAEMFVDLVRTLRREGTQSVLAQSLFNLGICRLSLGDTTGAEEALGEVAAIALEIGDRELEAAATGALGDAAEDRLDLSTARSLRERSAAVQRDIGDDLGLANSLTRLADLARHDADLERARDLIEESLALWRRGGQADGLAAGLYTSGLIDRAAGEPARAMVPLSEALSISAAVGRKRFIAVCLEAIGGALVDGGDAETAAVLIGCAETIREELAIAVNPADREQHDRDVASIRSALGPAADRALARGRRSPVADAVALATQRGQPKSER